MSDTSQCMMLTTRQIDDGWGQDKWLVVIGNSYDTEVEALKFIESCRQPTRNAALEEIQWRNIKLVVRTLADWAFGSRDNPKYGSSWVAMVTGLTAKDGPHFDLEPLKITPTVSQEK